MRNNIIKSISSNKQIKVLLLPLLLLMVARSANAQWAGEDQEILRLHDNSQITTLEADGGGIYGACYTWSGPNILEGQDLHQASIIIHPQAEEETYICTRVDNNGYTQDEVVVRVYDQVTIIKATPKKTCYQSGEHIYTDQFILKTQPAGYEGDITISPVIMPQLTWGTDRHGRKDIDITLSIEGQDSKTVSLPCVDKDASLSVETSPVEIYQFATGFEGIKNVAKRIRRAVDLHIAFGDYSPTTYNNWDWDMPTIGWHWDCCNEKIQPIIHLRWDGFRYKFEREFFTPPFLFGCVYASLGIEIILAIGHFEGDLSFDLNCGDAQLGVEFRGAVSGNLGVAALNPRLLSIQGGIEGFFSTQAMLDLRTLDVKGKAKLEVAFVGKITAISLTLCKHKKVLGVIPFEL